MTFIHQYSTLKKHLSTTYNLIVCVLLNIIPNSTRGFFTINYYCLPLRYIHLYYYGVYLVAKHASTCQTLNHVEKDICGGWPLLWRLPLSLWTLKQFHDWLAFFTECVHYWQWKKYRNMTTNKMGKVLVFY